MKRKIVLDTETTGLKPVDGHRILEIGAIELIDNVKTGKEYHQYINPERESDFGAFQAHGLTTEFLKDKPKFHEIVEDFLKFVDGAELVIHNADFDIGFLDSELDRANKGKIWNYIKNVTCTLKLDKRLFASERKHSLNAICERFGIDLSGRSLHGALLDSHLLADCFIKTSEMYSADDIEADLEQINWVRPEVKRYTLAKPLPTIKLTSDEEQKHTAFLQNLEKKDKVVPVFSKAISPKP